MTIFKDCILYYNYYRLWNGSTGAGQIDTVSADPESAIRSVGVIHAGEQSAVERTTGIVFATISPPSNEPPASSS